MSTKTIRKLVGAPVLGAAIVMIYLLVVGSALHSPKPHHLPIGLVAPAPLAQQIISTLQAKGGDALQISTYSSVAKATTTLHERKLSGILTVSPAGVRVTTASALGPVTASAVQQIGTALGQGLHMPITTTDLTPAAAGLGHSLVLMFLILLSTVAAILTQAIIGPAQRQWRVWIGATIATAVAIGFAGAASATLLGEYQHDFWPLTGILTLGALASACLSGGLRGVLGQAGLSISALLLIPFGVATAGVLSDVHFLPAFYEHLSAFMPSFATVTLIRQAAYFDGQAIAGPVAVLVGWLIAGLGLLALSSVFHVDADAKLSAQTTPAKAA